MDTGPTTSSSTGADETFPTTSRRKIILTVSPEHQPNWEEEQAYIRKHLIHFWWHGLFDRGAARVSAKLSNGERLNLWDRFTMHRVNLSMHAKTFLMRAFAPISTKWRAATARMWRSRQSPR